MPTPLTVNGVTYDLDVTFNVGARSYADPTSGVGLRPFLNDLRLELLARGTTNSSSTTSDTIATGSTTITLADNAVFVVGQWVTIANTANAANYMFGQVTGYNSGTKALTVNVSLTGGSGTFTAWTVSINGPRGAVGPAQYTYTDNFFRVQNVTDTTKQVAMDISLVSTGTTRTLTVPNANGTLVLLTLAQTLINKTLDNTTVLTIKAGNFTLQDTTTTTKQAVFDLSAIATSTTRTYTLQNANGTLAFTADITSAINAIPVQSTTAPGLLELATVSEVKTASDTLRPGSVGDMVNHPNMVRAMGTVSAAGALLGSNYIGVSSVSYSASVYTVNLAVTMADTNYCVNVNVAEDTGCTQSIKVFNKTTTSFSYKIYHTCDSGTSNITLINNFVVTGKVA